MVSKSYVPNHSLHKHYYGQGMARFKGSRMQYVKGLGSIFKRVALPLLSKGAKIAAPHVLKAAKGIGRELVGQLLDGSAMAPMPKKQKGIKRKITTKETISMKKPKQDTSDIF